MAIAPDVTVLPVLSVLATVLPPLLLPVLPAERRDWCPAAIVPAARWGDRNEA